MISLTIVPNFCLATLFVYSILLCNYSFVRFREESSILEKSTQCVTHGFYSSLYLPCQLDYYKLQISAAYYQTIKISYKFKQILVFSDTGSLEKCSQPILHYLSRCYRDLIFFYVLRS